jgi:hypothetical protein
MRQLSERLALLARRAIILSIIATAAHAAPPDASPDSHFKAVLIAGDRSARAFDHATAAMQTWLLARQVPQADIQRLSAARGVVAPRGVRLATLGNVLPAIEHLRPAPGQGCFVFATSHGAYDAGLVLVPSRNFLTPEAVDEALTRGCGDAPTIAIVSGCFTGGFTQPPMARANRIILTAARADRPSFGCGAGFAYTVYDRCLLSAIDRAADWPTAYATIQTCVSAREAEMHARPSEPQAWFGSAVRDMPIPQPP